jgi:predicted NBD/HSP70 family sugar kinase/biotin operon repressor
MPPEPRATPASRRRNRERVLAALRDAGSLPQIELARATGLSAATVSNVVRELSEEGWVDVSQMTHNGRRARRVRVAPGKGNVVGVDLAHRHLAVAVAGPDYDVLAEDSTQLTGVRALEDDLDLADSMIDALLVQRGRTRDEILSVGVAVPAPVEPTTGHPMPDGSLPGWRDAGDAATRIAARFGPTTLLENDANLDLIAESVWGAARGEPDAAYVHIATGIGSGLMSGGTVLRGAVGMAGELGHNTVDENGPLCRCGSRGCVDVYASTPAMLRLLRDHHGADLALPDFLGLLRKGDPAALRVVEDAGRHIGAQIAHLCNLLNPSVVLIGGDLGSAAEAMLDPIREQVRRHTMPGAGDAVKILVSELGERSTLLGAVVHAARNSRMGAAPAVAV